MRILLVNRFFGGRHTPTGRMLADVAQQLRSDGHRVTVLASRGSYAGPADDPEAQVNGVAVRHAWLSGSRFRLVAWLSFWLQALLLPPLMRWDRCVMLTDPPFLPFAWWLGHWFVGKPRKVFWWTMDLYPEALAASNLIKPSSATYHCLSYLNELGLSAVEGVIALGTRQLTRLRSYRNWSASPDFSTVVPPWDYRPIPRVLRKNNRVLDRFGWGDRKVALYAGNLGEAHSFEEILAAAKWFERRSRSDWVFAFVVRGAKRERLVRLSSGLENVHVLDYVPADQTSELLWSATVHVITLEAGWEGVVVPSKLYGVLETNAPILFIGPQDDDTASEVLRLRAGVCVNAGATGEEVADALDALSTRPPRGRAITADRSGPERIARFITQ